jgi:hypothetical protein
MYIYAGILVRLEEVILHQNRPVHVLYAKIPICKNVLAREMCICHLITKGEKVVGHLSNPLQ